MEEKPFAQWDEVYLTAPAEITIGNVYKMKITLPKGMRGEVIGDGTPYLMNDGFSYQVTFKLPIAVGLPETATLAVDVSVDSWNLELV